MNKLPKDLRIYIYLYIIFVLGFFVLLKGNINEMPAYLYIKKYIPTKNEEITTQKKDYKPDVVRGIYLTAYSAGSDSFRENIINSMTDSRINSVVIDIKDYSGYILYNSEIEELYDLDTVRIRIPDMKKVIDQFHEIGVYVIARQTVFQDPALAAAKPSLAFKTTSGNVWYDNKGLSWVDPSKKDVWEYNLKIAEEAIDLGFDEINFDYMRYPSDGNMLTLDYNLPLNQSKADVMADFFKFLSDKLSDKTNISIDTFGLVLDNINSGYDLNIGQKLVDIADYFDYVCPMMYPSHYPLTYLGYENSAEHPGAVISYGLDISSSTMATKRAKLRPWLQAFHMRATYDKAKIDAQTEATENVTSTDGWLLWNARNYYPDYIF